MDQYDRPVAGHLQALHQAEGHKVPDMERVGGRIKADVEGCPAAVDQLPDFFFVRHLRNQTARDEFIVDCHKKTPLFSFLQRASRISAALASSTVRVFSSGCSST